MMWLSYANGRGGEALYLDEVTDDADGIPEGALGLVDDHVVASTNEEGDGVALLAIFNDKDAVLGCTHRELANYAQTNRTSDGGTYQCRRDPTSQV